MSNYLIQLKNGDGENLFPKTSAQETSLVVVSGYTATSNRIRLIGGNIAEIHLYVESPTSFTKGSWVKIGNVPPGYIPSSTVYKMCLDNTNGYAIETRINPSGELSIWAPTSHPNFTLFAADILYTVD